MAAVAGPGIRVEILAGGPEAERAAALLNAVGMNLTPVAREHGKASAIKLCRSIMIKGLEALMVDSARACRHWGVEAEVYASLARTFPVDRLADARRRHGRARFDTRRPPVGRDARGRRHARRDRHRPGPRARRRRGAGTRGGQTIRLVRAMPRATARD